MNLKFEDNLLRKTKELVSAFKKEKFISEYEDHFPDYNINLLKENGYMGILIPNKYEGLNHTLETLQKVLEIIASECLSTALIFSMHCQQVQTIVKHGNTKSKNKYLVMIVKQRLLVGSVTSEMNNSNMTIKPNTSIEWYEKNKFELKRVAPIVTGGNKANAFLITANASDDTKRTVFIFSLREEMNIEVISQWEAMGLEETQSVGLKLHGLLTNENIVSDETFSEINKETFIPIAHLTWSACWLGATKSTYKDLLKLVRNNNISKRGDIVFYKISRINILIESVELYLKNTLSLYNENQDRKQNLFSNNNFAIKLNNLKIIASENLFEAVNIMVDIGGIEYGYKINEYINIEKLFRDLRSSSLMFHNNKLKLINGKMTLI